MTAARMSLWLGVGVRAGGTVGVGGTGVGVAIGGISVDVGGTGVTVGGTGVGVGCGVAVATITIGVGVAAGAPHPTKSDITNVTPIICCSNFRQLIFHSFLRGTAAA
jgi:hypothetical protein